MCMHGWTITLAIVITISTLASMALMLAILGGYAQAYGEAKRGITTKIERRVVVAREMSPRDRL